LLAQARETWNGTLMAVFQPAEETGKGELCVFADREDHHHEYSGGVGLSVFGSEQ
jgi:metal-dependent amidase/aminoacylase/carboxypeptidase family protein